MDANKKTSPKKMTKRKMAAARRQEPEPDEAHEHVMPVKVLLGVWGGLMVLTAATVAVARVDLGQINVIVALAVAVAKATLVALYFMHLKYDHRANRVVLVSALFFAVLFISFVVFDTMQYQPSLIGPG